MKPMQRVLPALTGLALAGCGWNHLPNQNNVGLSEPLWDAAGVAATTDGLYARLPHAGGMALIRSNGTFSYLDVGDGFTARLALAPDQETVIAFLDRYFCDEDDPRELRKIDTLAECPYGKVKTTTELAAVRDGTIEQTIALDGQFNAVEFSPDGRYAIAYLDFDASIDLSQAGVVNLTSVLVMDLASGVSRPVSVGFAASRVLFTDDASRAVVLSQSEVAVISLTTDPPTREVTFPLTLDPDQVVDPVGVDLTPDGRFALISAQGRSDLYVLDLVNHSVNIVSLSGNPAAMAVLDDPGTDRTVLVYAGTAKADVLEHELFDIETVGLDEPMTHILPGTGMALLYATGSQHDVYRLDPLTNDLVEFRLQNPAIGAYLAPTEDFAVVLTRAEGSGGTGIEGYYDASPGMEILDLTTDRGRSSPYLLESPGVGVAFSASDTALTALVLQSGVDYLFALDVYTGLDSELELSAPPVAIGAMPGGGFYITHDSDVGMVSFYDPVSGELVEVNGFAAAGLASTLGFGTPADTEQ